MNLYGSDMDEGVSPLACNMAWTVVHNDRDFIGEAAVQAARAARVQPRLIGVMLKERGVLRAHYPVYSGDACVGALTSGAFSPTLQCGIGFARVSASTQPLFVEIRGKQTTARTRLITVRAARQARLHRNFVKDHNMRT